MTVYRYRLGWFLVSRVYGVYPIKFHQFNLTDTRTHACVFCCARLTTISYKQLMNHLRWTINRDVTRVLDVDLLYFYYNTVR